MRTLLVVGMARSGVAAAKLGLRTGWRVVCTDTNPNAPRVDGCEHVYGEHRRSDFLAADRIVVSPGVPARQPDVAAAVAAGKDVVGELAFAAEQLACPIYAVSGTNGKSTTTHLLGQILSNAGVRTYVGGNIGTPLSDAVGGDWEAVAVEVSSYQMELPGAFRPRAAAILNLTPDHLERHGTMEAYGAYKCRMFARMGPNDAAIVPAGDPRLVRLADAQPGKRLFLDGSPGVRIEGDHLVLDGVHDPGAVALAGFALPGEHNRHNLACAVLLALCAGLWRRDVDVTRLVGLAHRLEPVGERAGVTYVDDSKATNVDSTLVALAAFPRAVVLLGGRGKAGAPYEALARPLRDARVVCFGEAGPRIADALGAAGIAVTRAGRLADAVAAAAALASPGDVVLLSPACASFDEFTDFEHRGRAFRSLVEGLP
ncbi:MAG: UDP-N-acetylmuramoyl-L-alanine--D-glutamate ligase [Myxococcota bacterium]